MSQNCQFLKINAIMYTPIHSCFRYILLENIGVNFSQTGLRNEYGTFVTATLEKESQKKGALRDYRMYILSMSGGLKMSNILRLT